MDSSLAQEFTQPEPLVPEIAEASDEPYEAMATVRLPEQWKIELFAAEPLVANIVAFDIDHRGRLYVCESYRQNRGVTDNRGHDQAWLMADLAAQTVQDRIDYHKRLLGEAVVTYAQHDDRIRRIDDTDGDHVADQAYVLAKGFNRIEEGTGAGVLVRGSDIYYTNIPKLWKLVDKDDNGDAEERVALSDGYGVRVAFRGHDLHGLILGPDGRVYFTIGDRGYHVTTNDGRVLSDPASGAVFRCELDGSGLEVFATGLRNPQELAFNDWGDLFTVDNNSDSGDQARIVHLLEGGDSGWRMYYQYLPDRGPFNREKIWHPFHAEQATYIVPPITNFTDGPSGLAMYPGTGFGDSLKNKFLICDFRGGPANSGIRSFQLDADGAFYRLADDDDPIWTVLATDVAFGPDGALYVSDWVDGWNGLGKGRIYRITDPAHSESQIVKEVQNLLAGDWSARLTEDLSSDLDHVDRRIRLESQWELARRKATDELVSLIEAKETKTLAKLHAIWAADQIVRRSEDSEAALVSTVRALLGATEPVLRAAAAKFAGEHADKEAVPLLQGIVADKGEHPRVSYFATLSLGKLKAESAFAAVVSAIATNNNSDPALRHSGVMYLTTAAPDKVAQLSEHSSAAVRRSAVVALRRRASGLVGSFLGDADVQVTLETARAIHDLPIPAATSKLAALISGKIDHPELLRRVLNANYRLGTAESAEALARFAADHSKSSEMRIEALEMLRSWQNPSPIDRVIGAYRPMGPRDQKLAIAAVTPHVDALLVSQSEVREQAIGVMADLRIAKVAPALIETIVDQQAASSARATALRALAKLDSTAAKKLCSEIRPVPAPDLFVAALSVLSELDHEGSVERFVSATEARNLQIRQLAWDLLAKSKSPAASRQINAAVKKYLEGSLDVGEQLNVLEASAGVLSEDLASQLEDYEQQLAQQDPLGPWLTALEGGDPKSGNRIFVEKTALSCQRCHRVGRSGGEVGPELTTIAKQRDRRYLLEAICLPNAQVAKGFETAVIATELGEVFTGIVKSETDDYVELIQNDGSLKRILQEEIIRRKKGLSSMPDDLVQKMTKRELRDLVAYLSTLKADPRSAADVE